ncbi:palmitoyltransferase ZDHHC6-like isoform X2 [Watersipora subatra]|uniref:palmitoyltransferase ZDHHC6-like isoform X2 n=1 Tax=Watersipora subatra TaxID=2589382 RepID=UPI00355C54C8
MLTRKMLNWLKRTLDEFCSRYGSTILNTISPIWFLLCILGLNWMAYDHIFEYLYETKTILRMIFQCVTWFMSGQMIIHWIFLCKVKSNYLNTEEDNAKRLAHEEANPQFKSEGIEYEQLRQIRPTLGTGNWSVITEYTNNEVKKTAYPYWGWKPCVVCSFYKPPRCHHCPICNVCILKRDHHCFFARQCVGLHNQRYFVVFNLWAGLLTTFATPQLMYYTYAAVWPHMTAMDLCLPWTLVKYLLGGTSFYILTVVFQNYSLIFFILTAGHFLREQLHCIEHGITSFELDTDNYHLQPESKSMHERFACVFGRENLWLNILIPYHWASRPTDDGIVWASMKME